MSGTIYSIRWVYLLVKSERVEIPPQYSYWYHSINSNVVFQDAINCIGGVQVLFPLLEQINKAPEGQLIDLGEGSVAVSTSPAVVSVEEQDDWVVVPSSSYAGQYWSYLIL